MKVNFDQLPVTAKVWMYQAPRAISSAERKIVDELSAVFLDQWESHGIPVQGSVDVLNNHFIRIGAYTNEPSMCGRAQDGQVRLVKEIETELNLELTNRMMLAFETTTGVEVVHMNMLEEAIGKGIVTSESLYFNNLVQNKADFESSWKTAVNSTWLSRYFS